MLLARRLAVLRLRCEDVSIAPRSALARGAAQRDRRHRRAGPQPFDAARRHHRSADPGEADPGGRIGVPSAPLGRHTAPPAPPPSPHPPPHPPPRPPPPLYPTT